MYGKKDSSYPNLHAFFRLKQITIQNQNIVALFFKDFIWNAELQRGGGRDLPSPGSPLKWLQSLNPELHLEPLYWWHRPRHLGFPKCICIDLDQKWNSQYSLTINCSFWMPVLQVATLAASVQCQPHLHGFGYLISVCHMIR